MGILVWDDKFNMAPPENQQAILDFCNMLEFESDIVKDNIVECWIKMFDKFVQKASNQELSVPLQNEKDFYDYLFRFIEEDIDGRTQFRTQRLGFVNVEPTEEYPYDRRLQYMVIAALSIGDSRDSRELKNPIYEKWEATLKEFDDKAPEGL